MKVILTGHKEIDRVLKALPKELQHSIQQQAHVDAAKPLIEKEKLLAPEGPTGNLVDSIGAVKIPLRRANFIGEVHVGPRRGRRYRGHHAHLVEFGTKLKIGRASCRERGYSAAVAGAVNERATPGRQAREERWTQ